MNPRRRKRVEEVFDQVLDHSKELWPGLLVEFCDGDGDLEMEVRVLLAAHGRVDGILDREAGFQEGAGGISGEPGLPEQVGRYRILREVGRGGMGTVYLAERADGHFKQRVALKLIPSREEKLASRIVAERQILASLQHPNIARLLDGGLTDDGRPYLVMEYVSGLPVDVYCDRMRLTIRERVQVFLTILGAVEHAHHNLVVHRDLKPSNIFVSPSGEVKLLDFGIAKLLSTNLGGVEMPVTRHRDRALTPEYTSPEQVRGEGITTAADVYSLGIVLYQLLTGCRPYSVASGALDELVRVVCEVDPPSPSVKVSGRGSPGQGENTLRGEERRAAAAARRTTTSRHERSLKGDLDAIVMKALRKEPGRRYASAERLARDLRDYLDGRPVRARRGSRWYRVRKFASRHRVGALATTAVIVSVLGGSGTAAWQAGVAGRERDRARAALRESEEVTQFLLGLFEASDPQETPGDTVTALDLLRRGEQRAASLEGEPLVQARLLQVMAQAQRNLGRYGDAEALAARSVDFLESDLGQGSPEMTEAYLGLGIALKNNGKYDSARVVVERALKGLETETGVGRDIFLLKADIFEELARILIYLGDVTGAEERAVEALAIKERTLGGAASSTLNTRSTLASIHRFQGRYDLAEVGFRRVLAERRGLSEPDRSGLTRDMLQLGDMIRIRGGNLDEALALFEEAVTLLHDGSARASQDFVWGLTSMARIMEMTGDLDRAEALLGEAVEVRRRTFGDVHPLVAESMGEYAAFLTRIGRPGEAEALLRDVIEMDLATVGPRHSRHAGTLAGLAMAVMEQGRLAEADSLNRAALGIRIAAQGDRTLAVAQALAAGAEIKVRMERFDEAESMLQEALSIVADQPAQSAIPSRIHGVFVGLYQAWGKPSLANRHRQLVRAGT